MQWPTVRPESSSARTRPASPSSYAAMAMSIVVTLATSPDVVRPLLRLDTQLVHNYPLMPILLLLTPCDAPDEQRAALMNGNAISERALIGDFGVTGKLIVRPTTLTSVIAVSHLTAFLFDVTFFSTFKFHPKITENREK